jgi:hypothetical protein
MYKNTKTAALVKMRSTTLVIAGAIILIGSGVARASDNEECSNATLNGSYAFHASGFNIVAGVAQPKAILEIIQFNGDGTLVVPAATVSINGVVTRSPPGGTGSYVVTPGCVGSLAFGPPGPTFDFSIGFRQSELFLIQTGPGSPVFEGTAERLSR